MTTSKTTLDAFSAHCVEFANVLHSKEDELMKLLSHYETHETARDEIERSIETLEGMAKELSSIDNPLADLTIATFFPLNLPLYSLVLFAIAPSVFSKNVFIRPPEVMHQMLRDLWEFLDIPHTFPNISLKIVPRQIFMELYAGDADAIIFTGKYENALAVHKQCPEALLLYNGSGVNPFLLFTNADVDLAVAKAVEMRCFNSGQDCAGPDAFFVPSSLADGFTSKLQARLADIKVGDTANPATDVGPTIKESYITELTEWLSHHKESLVYGGEIDAERHLVHPTIVRQSVTEHDGKVFHEFFAPFFYVLEYANDQELERLLLSPAFKERGMYISVFGSNTKLEPKLDFVKLLHEKIVNDTERGNEEYGGYGPHANFLLYHNEKIVKPVLVSRDLHQALQNWDSKITQLV